MGNSFSSEPEPRKEDEDDESTETHYSSECRYVSVAPKPGKKYWNPHQGRYTTAAQLLRRVCKCGRKMGSQEKVHFSEMCAWFSEDLGTYYELRENCYCHAIGDPLPYNEP